MQFAYLAAGGIFLTVWVALFATRKDLRRAMLTMSCMAAPLGLFDFWFVPRYWQPVTLFHLPVGIEGIIYSFCLGGVTTTLYAAITGKSLTRHGEPRLSSIAPLVLTGAVFLTFLAFGVPNPMVALYAGLATGLGFMLVRRHDLARVALGGGVLFGVLYAILIKIWLEIFPGVRHWFVLEGLPKLFIVGVPLWEVLFGVLFAAYWGGMYEFLFGYKLDR